jgi:thioredoxin-related protein
MKKLLLFIAIFSFSFSGIAQEGKINWMSFNEAVAAQTKEPKKIMMDVFTTWCGPCKMLDKNTFQHKNVVEYVNKNYYAVKFNAEGDGDIKYKDQTFSNPNFDASRKGRNSQHQLAGAFGVTAYPTIIFLDENADVLLPVKGYHNPKQLEIFLKVFATNAYKNINSKEDFAAYQKEFKSDFND